MVVTPGGGGLLDEMGPTSVTPDTAAVVAAVAMLLLNKDKHSNSHVTESCSLQIFFPILPPTPREFRSFKTSFIDKCYFAKESVIFALNYWSKLPFRRIIVSKMRVLASWNSGCFEFF